MLGWLGTWQAGCMLQATQGSVWARTLLHVLGVAMDDDRMCALEVNVSAAGAVMGLLSWHLANAAWQGTGRPGTCSVRVSQDASWTCNWLGEAAGGGSWMSMLFVHWSGPGYKELCLVHAYMSPWPPAVASYSVLG